MIAVLRFLFVIPIAFVLACVTAGFAMLWPFMNTEGVAGGDPLFFVEAGLGLLAQTAQVGATALYPWAAFMLVTESLGWRSILLHMAAGVAGGYGALRSVYGDAMPHGSVQTAVIVAGLAFALVYWIVAGRSAGRWRRRERLPQAAPQTGTETVETVPRA
ncbi:MAG: hypothetical protein H7Y08_05800 [Rhizobiaceae bacterium]|nr:hypothetical protein [Rhizobiaceae bacterium]